MEKCLNHFLDMISCKWPPLARMATCARFSAFSFTFASVPADKAHFSRRILALRTRRFRELLI